jgi:soluble lytic murein transglycosylase
MASITEPPKHDFKKLIKKYSPSIIKRLPTIIFSITIIYLLIAIRGLNGEKEAVESQALSSLINIEREVNKLQAGISQNDIRRWNILGVQKWISQTNKKLTEATCYSYATAIVDESERQKVDIALIASVAQQESYYKHDEVSWADAVGLMGIMEETGKWISGELGVAYSDELLKDPEMNIRIGTWFIRYLMGKYKNNEVLVMAHYNGGNKGRSQYLLKQKHKNAKEFKLPAKELKAKLESIKQELILAGKTKEEFRENVNYKYIEEVYLGKTFKTETENYIPEVLTRRKKIKEFLAEPESLTSS